MQQLQLAQYLIRNNEDVKFEMQRYFDQIVPSIYYFNDVSNASNWNDTWSWLQWHVNNYRHPKFARPNYGKFDNGVVVVLSAFRTY